MDAANRTVILIVEDHTETLRDLKTALIREGVTPDCIEGAADGQAGRKKFDALKKNGRLPTVIVANCWLKEEQLGGVTFVEYVTRQKYPPSRVLFYSRLAWDKSEIRDREEALRRLEVCGVSKEKGNLISKQDIYPGALAAKIKGML